MLLLNTLISKISLESDYARRIKYRHAKFWQDPQAEHIRNTALSAHDPLCVWREGENWQRKLSNKFNSREFAKMHDCKVPALFWRGRNIATIDFDSLPENYVIRPTIGHSCQSVFIMKKGINLFDHNRYSPKDLREFLRRRLAENHRLEFLIEEFLTNEEGEKEILKDYKIFTFRGHIAAILMIDRLSPKTGFQSCYTENWEPIAPLVVSYPQGTFETAPACLAEMISDAKKLSRTYEIFTRIDFYATAGGAVFGEFSPTPLIGNGSTPFASRLFKTYWDRYCYQMI
ncbi:ATP-grasp fold amidoligase family protein [Mucilaginibacter aquaedulcis]|uniref:ATP-grasp fold amidoligase family protein n=1 Tax=Mucilaginibacter aquaedulcis TaxID=1187081 RepID=UPI0025B3B2C5|nr:ATP-grasp fold amidoligase family protein [Mucilaginibacter aquaedulcis]MDN3548177.1 ATP-grasp fold amidoligase family protein [Mucilaginibacter aquaedulcis]